MVVVLLRFAASGRIDQRASWSLLQLARRRDVHGKARLPGEEVVLFTLAAAPGFREKKSK